jgi:hypothetical protein
MTWVLPQLFSPLPWLGLAQGFSRSCSAPARSRASKVIRLFITQAEAVVAFVVVDIGQTEATAKHPRAPG